MQILAWIFCLISQTATEAEPRPAQPSGDALDALRRVYRDDAEKYRFQLDLQERKELELVARPIMRWATDDDWSGDLFLWTHEKRPAVVGCILSGPTDNDRRLIFHEFHLLSDKPLANVQLQTGHQWQPKSALEVKPVPDAPQPAKNATGRLTQMRQMSRDFTAHMQADGEWELRSLPQPLFRYGDEKGEILDGALFTYVWPKGTDPEVILLLECRKTPTRNLWYYAPIRFSTRPLWLTYHGNEIWRVESHQEPKANATDLIYTTDYARTIPRPAAEEKKD